MRATLLIFLLGFAGTALGAAELRLERQEGGAELGLCFTRDSGPVDYDVRLELQGPGGVSHSRQRGSGSGGDCPVTTRIRAAAGSTLKAQLEWRQQGQPQPSVERSLQL